MILLSLPHFFKAKQRKRRGGKNLQVVDQQLVQGRIGVQVDKEALVILHFDP